jgi:O-acetylhomoserine/O-acetylserine sulfhydrylase-like pyridoxal-dependent enzyme
MILKIINIVMAGKIPLTRKLSMEDFSKIIKNSQFDWVCENEKYTPFLMAKIDHNNKKVCVSLWAGGHLQLMGGIISRKDGEKIYNHILKDLRQHIDIMEICNK